MNRTLHMIKHFFVGVALLGVLLPATPAAALDYAPLAPIPGTTKTNCNWKLMQDLSQKAKQAGCSDFALYLENGFKLAIAAAGVLAFLMIVIGGFQYMSTDAISEKSEGKERIKGAIFGLILALGSYVFLKTINSDLVLWDLNFGGEVKGVVSDLETLAGFNRSNEDIDDFIARVTNDLKNASLEAQKFEAEASILEREAARRIKTKTGKDVSQLTPEERKQVIDSNPEIKTLLDDSQRLRGSSRTVRTYESEKARIETNKRAAYKALYGPGFSERFFDAGGGFTDFSEFFSGAGAALSGGKPIAERAEAGRVLIAKMDVDNPNSSVRKNVDELKKLGQHDKAATLEAASRKLKADFEKEVQRLSPVNPSDCVNGKRKVVSGYMGSRIEYFVDC